MRKRLGELLVERGLIDRAQLHEALGVQRRNGMRLGDVLIACGHIEEVALTRALGDLLEIASVDLDGLQPDPHAIEMVSARFAAEHDVFPVALRRERGRRVLTVAMSNPMDMSAVDELGFMTNAHIETRLASVTDIDRAIRQVYGARLAGVGPTHPLALREDSRHGRMTILRRGGGEEEIDTGSFAEPPATIPFDPATEDLPVVGPAKPDPILLTEEIEGEEAPSAPRRSGASSSDPGSPGPSSGWASTVVSRGPETGSAARPPPLPRTDHRSSTEPSGAAARVASGPQPPARSGPPVSDLQLGALVGASGQVVDAEAFMRLERRVWAILRILSRKGVVTKEEFMSELGGDSHWS